MDTPRLLQEAYRRFWLVVESKSVPPPCQFLPYQFTIEHPSGSVQHFFYATLEEEFTRELINNINQLASNTHKLSIWEAALQEFSEDERLEIRHEFTRTLLYYCLHQPYEYRQRLIYCSVQLCFEAGLHRDTIDKTDIVDDSHIDYRTLEKLEPQWNAITNLLGAIRRINDKEHVASTKNYRNKSQHQIAPGLEYGHTNRTTRILTSDNKLAYSYGQIDPITTAQTLPLLKEQSGRMIDGFKVYWDLVQEQAQSVVRETYMVAPICQALNR